MQLELREKRSENCPRRSIENVSRSRDKANTACTEFQTGNGTLKRRPARVATLKRVGMG